MVVTAKPWQLKAAKTVVEQNTIIHAPTGGGKTLVAVLVIDRFLAAQPLKKVLFIVPSLALVEQQSEYIKNYCVHIDEMPVQVARIRHQRIDWECVCSKHHVLVATADIFRHAFVNSGSVKVTSFSLAIFDECHHIIGNSPMVSLLRDALLPSIPAPPVASPSSCTGNSSKTPSNSTNLRLMGLTASFIHGSLTDLEHKKAELQILLQGNLVTPEIFMDNTENTNSRTIKPLEEINLTDEFIPTIVPKKENNTTTVTMRKDEDNIISKKYHSLAVPATKLAGNLLQAIESTLFYLPAVCTARITLTMVLGTHLDHLYSNVGVVAVQWWMWDCISRDDVTMKLLLSGQFGHFKGHKSDKPKSTVVDQTESCCPSSPSNDIVNADVIDTSPTPSGSKPKLTKSQLIKILFSDVSWSRLYPKYSHKCCKALCILWRLVSRNRTASDGDEKVYKGLCFVERVETTVILSKILNHFVHFMTTQDSASMCDEKFDVDNVDLTPLVEPDRWNSVEASPFIPPFLKEFMCIGLDQVPECIRDRDPLSVASVGDESEARNVEDKSEAMNAGDESEAMNVGDESEAMNVGDESEAMNVGNGCQVGGEWSNSDKVGSGGCSLQPVEDTLYEASQSSLIVALPVSGGGSMSELTRTTSIQRFREYGEGAQGGHRHCVCVLVSTSALEEGLDIPSCSVVLRYDRFFTPKSHIQGSGRARFKFSEIFYFENNAEEEQKKQKTLEKSAHCGSMSSRRLDQGLRQIERDQNRTSGVLYPYFPTFAAMTESSANDNIDATHAQVNFFNCLEIFYQFIQVVFRHPFKPEDVLFKVGMQRQRKRIRQVFYPTLSGMRFLSCQDVDCFWNGRQVEAVVTPLLRMQNMSQWDKEKRKAVYVVCLQLHQLSFLDESNKATGAAKGDTLHHVGLNFLGIELPVAPVASDTSSTSTSPPTSISASISCPASGSVPVPPPTSAPGSAVEAKRPIDVQEDVQGGATKKQKIAVEKGMKRSDHVVAVRAAALLVPTGNAKSELQEQLLGYFKEPILKLTDHIQYACTRVVDTNDMFQCRLRISFPVPLSSTSGEASGSLPSLWSFDKMSEPFKGKKAAEQTMANAALQTFKNFLAVCKAS